ncbi:MAG: copper amine oxidase N-terminal domain-containing protein, partial [Candidatus Eremiobacteraeota bacterium]|nr:copper amine oxidase N-terminal domain-containing protein [Candidatus Eremiobacteraeota bacterium]
MKRWSTAIVAALVFAGFGGRALAQEAPDFGSPPSGQIPILFNDHHVYAKPDKLKEGRVLAALVRDGTVLIPLRSMFEQMGASVAYDPGSKTVSVAKPGEEIKVTVGRPEVTINGESRPLDVPPEIYQGHVVVPVRVISEAMGAYVQWVPEQRVVVVRWVPPTTPAPPPPPTTPAPTATPSPSPVPTPYKDLFIAGDFIVSPTVYNEYDPGIVGSGTGSIAARGAWEFDLGNIPFMIEGDYRQFLYPHPTNSTTPVKCPKAGEPGCVTVIGNYGQTF